MTYYLLEQKDDAYYSAPALMLPLEQHSFNALASSILHALAKEPAYPTLLAKTLGMHEQKIYYHIRKLEAAGIIHVVKTEHINGSNAKYYGLVAPVLCTQLGELEKSSAIQQLSAKEESYLSPFITKGHLSATIITGSPDPHGPEKARSRDGYYAIDLGLFLGKYLHHTPRPTVMLDTEFRDNWKQNLILIGGPVTNGIVAKINEYLPVYFDPKKSNNVYSKISKQEYASDEIGIIVKIPNPFSPEHSILLIAGKRYQGTRAAILTFLTSFDQLILGNRVKSKYFATVVEGVDLDSDGHVDAVELRE